MTLGTFQAVIFWAVAVVALLAAWKAITGKNLVHNLYFFGLFLLMISSLYFLLQSNFVALVQILVYVGGVLILLLFGIMLTFKIADTKLRQANDQVWPSLIIMLGLLVFLLVNIQRATFTAVSKGATKVSVPVIGKLILSDYVLPFEIVGFILLAAIVGAVVIVKEEKDAS